MSDVIDFICIRITSELDKYQRTKTLPHDLLDGEYTVEDIESCKANFSKKHQKLADKVIKEYNSKINESFDSLKIALRKEYSMLVKTARTRDPKFTFKHLTAYRPGINPIRALYYETREVVRRFNPEDEKHIWLTGLVTDKIFNNEILDALEHDIKRLERILKRYYWPLLKHEDNVPLELFHVRQLIKDARHYYNFFFSLQHWMPDE